MATTAAAWLRRFDRNMRFRNGLEYFAGGLSLASLVRNILFDSRRNLTPYTGLVLVASSYLILWWQHRSDSTPDPTSDVVTFRGTLLRRFDHQIRQLCRIKYRYPLPISLRMLIFNWDIVSQGSSQRRGVDPLRPGPPQAAEC